VTVPLAKDQISLDLVPPEPAMPLMPMTQSRKKWIESDPAPSLGLVPYDYVAKQGEIGVWLFVAFRRVEKRAKCSTCGQRRILFTVGLGEIAASPGRCAKCAGIR